MTIISPLAFLSLLGVSIFFTPCNGQVKTNLPKENATISAGQPKLIKTQGSDEGWNVHCSLQDKKGNIWFATTGEGVYRYDGKSFTNFTTKDGLNSNFIFSIVEDKKGNLWFATTTGVSHYDGKTFKNFSTEDGLPHNGVLSLLEDKAGNIWIGTTNVGLSRYDGKTFTSFSE